MPALNCNHPALQSCLDRFEEGGRIGVTVEVRCRDCLKRFRFLGSSTDDTGTVLTVGIQCVTGSSNTNAETDCEQA